MNRILALFFAVLAFTSVQAQTFTNPLLPSGADPYSFHKDGYYYYTHTTGRNIVLYKSKTIDGIKDAPKKVIYTPPKTGPYSKNLWAPEVVYLKGKWYAYFAADGSQNIHHRMYVLENPSADPMEGEWTFKGQITDSTNKWAIDGDVIEHGGNLYMVWSGWEGDDNGRQDIYIAKLKNPWTVEGPRVKLSSPEFEWEKHGDLNEENLKHVDVNEGPQFLVHKNRIFIIYSGSGCWTDHYALGMLTASAKSDLLDPKSWKKSPEPVFKGSVENGVYSPGHNSFFKSPDGTEDWILYHANDKPGQGCGGFRSPRAQKFTWNKDGTPNFGIPVKTGVPLNIPAEKK
jgi:GH43 family beta-xylosidase